MQIVTDKSVTSISMFAKITKEMLVINMAVSLFQKSEVLARTFFRYCYKLAVTTHAPA